MATATEAVSSSLLWTCDLRASEDALLRGKELLRAMVSSADFGVGAAVVEAEGSSMKPMEVSIPREVSMGGKERSLAMLKNCGRFLVHLFAAWSGHGEAEGEVLGSWTRYHSTIVREAR